MPAFPPGHPGLIIAVQILHGICYAFFFATVYIFVDAYFLKDARASAQGLFNVMIPGGGAGVIFSPAEKSGDWLNQAARIGTVKYFQENKPPARPAGPYLDMSGATSPYTNRTGNAKFFRLRH